MLEVDLSANKIGNAGAAHIRKTLDVCAPLLRAFLHACRESNADRSFSLQANKVLESVNLSENKLQSGADLASFLDVDSFFFPQLTFSRRIGK